MPPARIKKISTAFVHGLWVLLLVALAVFLLMPRREPFQEAADASKPQNISSRDLYRNRRDYEKAMDEINLARTDLKDIFIAHSCFQLPVKDAMDTLNGLLAKQPFLYKTWTMSMTSLQDLTSRFQSEVTTLFERNGRKPLAGPLYAIIMQAPYYYDDDGTLLSIQFNAGSYALKPYNIMRKNLETPPLFAFAALLAPAYNSNDTMLKGPLTTEEAVQRMKFLDPYRSKELQCFMECPNTKDTFPTYCGCLSMTKGTNGIAYDTKCLGPHPSNDHKGNISGYGNVYVLNPSYPAFYNTRMIVELPNNMYFLRSAWTCVPGTDKGKEVYTPVRMNASGDVECMAIEKGKCAQMTDIDTCRVATFDKPDPKKPSFEPVVCTQDQYNLSDHWCAKGINAL